VKLSTTPDRYRWQDGSPACPDVEQTNLYNKYGALLDNLVVYQPVGRGGFGDRGGYGGRGNWNQPGVYVPLGNLSDYLKIQDTSTQPSEQPAPAVIQDSPQGRTLSTGGDNSDTDDSTPADSGDDGSDQPAVNRPRTLGTGSADTPSNENIDQPPP
jgi:hypothetical protein